MDHRGSHEGAGPKPSLQADIKLLCRGSDQSGTRTPRFCTSVHWSRSVRHGSPNLVIIGTSEGIWGRDRRNSGSGPPKEWRKVAENCSEAQIFCVKEGVTSGASCSSCCRVPPDQRGSAHERHKSCNQEQLMEIFAGWENPKGNRSEVEGCPRGEGGA